jgi:3-phosphoshikimate 1-carboxyvinyltransferase
MSAIRIYPCALRGRIAAPPSKSAAHRALICAALSEGVSHLEAAGYSDDIEATLDAVAALGAVAVREGENLSVTGISPAAGAQAPCGMLPLIDCNESGSTLRFLIPVALAVTGGGRFTGRGNLGARPLGPYLEIFARQGIECTRRTEGGRLDMTLKGRLTPGHFSLPGNVSSQFVSGLLFALPLLEGDSTVELTTPLESEGYLDMTLAALGDFGVRVSRPDRGRFEIPGGQRFQSRRRRIEGDYSQAAFFLAAGAMGSALEVEGLDPDSLQADRAMLEALTRMGAGIRRDGESVSASAGRGELKGALLDGAQCPDIVPILAAAASVAEGRTEITGSARLRLKECDRLQAVSRELCRLGASVKERADGLEIEGQKMLPGGVRVSSHRDHRIAMTLAVAATRCRDPIELEDPECVAKSYPGFWADYAMLGGRFEACR